MSDLVTSLAERLLNKAAALNITIASAESCTAGRLASVLADAPGAGDRFQGGFVTYTKQNKIAVLDVPAETIAAFTAVSRPVAEAMARGALKRCPADVAIAITGVAGPEPDEDGNPVGLMHVAVVVRNGIVLHRQEHLPQADRAVLRQQAMLSALKLADTALTEMPLSTV